MAAWVSNCSKFIPMRGLRCIFALRKRAPNRRLPLLHCRCRSAACGAWSVRSVGVGLAGGEAWTVWVGGDGDGDGDGDSGAWRAGRRPVADRLAAELRLCKRK